MRYAIVLLFLFGCHCDCPGPLYLAADFFPLHQGLSQIYSIDSVVISQNIETTYSYEMKTVVTDSFPNAAGGFTYSIERFKRITPASAWSSTGTWSARSDEFQATVNEGNISFIRIVNPIYDGRQWDGNALNILGGTEKCPANDSHTCDLYEIRKVNQPYIVSADLSFDNTFTVVENDNGDLIVAQDKRSQVYALHTGLVYREITRLEYCTDTDCLGAQFVDKGLKFKQRIVSYEGL